MLYQCIDFCRDFAKFLCRGLRQISKISSPVLFMRHGRRIMTPVDCFASESGTDKGLSLLHVLERVADAIDPCQPGSNADDETKSKRKREQNKDTAVGAVTYSSHAGGDMTLIFL